MQKLAKMLGAYRSGVSQHLSVLRAHRIALERREGRRVYYRLRQKHPAAWLLHGMEFLTSSPQASEELRSAIGRVRVLLEGTSTSK